MVLALLLLPEPSLQPDVCTLWACQRMMLFPKRQLDLRQAHHTLSLRHCMAWCLSAPSPNLFSNMRVITVL